MDAHDVALQLRVVDVWQDGNETGYITPKILYDPSLGMAPWLGAVDAWLLHGTAGRNTLRFWGEGGSAVAGNWTLAQLLVPRDQTAYADGKVHDTSFTVFKMAPDGSGCNHAGPCCANITNSNSIGVEHESLQNGTHDITPLMYTKSALLYAHDSAKLHLKDWRCQQHGIVAINPVGRRSDPYAGLFDIAYWWSLVVGIRADARIWQYWGLSQPVGLGGK